MPKVETRSILYTKMLPGNGDRLSDADGGVFSSRKMGLVSRGLLWSNIKYAILVIFILAAF